MNSKKVISAVLAVLFITTAASACMVVDSESNDADVVTFASSLLGFSSGFSQGFWVGLSIFMDPSESDSSQEEVNAALRQAESEKVTFAGESVRAFAGTVLPADVSLWSFTQEHWNRSAELAVIDNWMVGRSYNPDFILERSMQRANINAYMYDWQAAFDNFYTHSFIDHVGKWDMYDYLDDMTAKLVWNGGSSNLKNSVIDFSTIIQNASYGSTFYLDADTHVEKGTYQQGTSGSLYKLSSGIVKLRNEEGRVVTINSLVTDLSELRYDSSVDKVSSGLYTIETVGASLAGPISQSADDSGYRTVKVDGKDVKVPLVKGAMVFSNSSDIYWFTVDDGQTYLNSFGSSPRAVTELSLDISYIDRKGNTAVDSTYLVTDDRVVDGVPVFAGDLIRDWSSLIDKFNLTLGSAAIAGQTIWDVFDICQETIPAFVSSLTDVDIEGYSLSSAQSKAVLIARMQQIYNAWSVFGGALSDQLPQTFSVDSLDLYIQGDIYYNGSLYAENVVFTPFSALEYQYFEVDKMTVWQNAGFAMIWGTGDITGWSGPTSTSGYDLMFIGSGYEIDVKNIGSNGVLRESAGITPEQIKKATVDPTPSPDPQPTVTLRDNSVVLLAVLSILAGLALGVGICNKDLRFLILIGLILTLVVYLMVNPPDIMGFFRGLF